MTILLDPTGGREAPTTGVGAGASASASPGPAARLASINGVMIGLLDIGKPRGDVFLDAIEQRLRDHGATTLRYVKASYARVVPIDLRREIAGRCQAVIVALAD